MLFEKKIKNTRRVGIAQTTFYEVSNGKIDYIFSVTPIPLSKKCPETRNGGIWNGDYVMVTLLNLSQRTYFLELEGPPLGWEYIAEKYRLEDDVAIGFTKILGKILGREVKCQERNFKVIQGGKEAKQWIAQNVERE